MGEAYRREDSPVLRGEVAHGLGIQLHDDVLFRWLEYGSLFLPQKVSFLRYDRERWLVSGFTGRTESDRKFMKIWLWSEHSGEAPSNERETPGQ